MSKDGNTEESGAAFKEAYASLNAAQKQAVDTIDGPVMVIAGPGTGKTQILTLRIANILLKTDTAPESILALTFTESGAKAMRERLRRYVGVTAYRVPIYTFHGLCGDLIRRYPDAYPNIIGGNVATDLDRISLIEEVLSSAALKLLRPLGNPLYYVKPILSELSELKREYITPNKLSEIIARDEEALKETEQYHSKGAHKGKVRGEYSTLLKSINKNKELLTVYRLYEALKLERRLYDFDDMISETIVALKSSEDMLRDLQEQYQYLLADEHQDVNGAQNEILKLLASYHNTPNIFVVGDEKQAIYRFQGASLENFLYFEDYFKGTTTIALIENYRSGQTILDAAHSLVAVEDGPLRDLRVPLKAAAVPAAAIKRKTFSHQAVEEDDLVDTVKSAIAAGTTASEIAVIVRTNAAVEHLTKRLRTAGVAVNPSADSDILNHPLTKTIEHLLAAVAKPEDATALFTVLHGNYWGISVADLFKVCAAQNYERSLPALVYDESELRDLGVSDLVPWQRLTTVLTTARSKSLTESPQRVLAYLIETSGLYHTILSNDPTEFRVIRRLYDEIEALVVSGRVKTVSEVAELFSQYQSHQIALSAPYIGSTSEAVSVMTAHKSKGLEFDTVFIPYLTDRDWGGKAGRQNFKIAYTKHTHDEYDNLDDERRLLYVALTRAKTALWLSSSDTSADGKVLQESRLLSELAKETLTSIDTAQTEARFSPAQVLVKSEGDITLTPEVLVTTLKERGFSATSLNNFITSPWNYVYRNVLRLPEVQPLHLMYGTAMHSVLEQVTKTYSKTQSIPTMNDAKGFLESALRRLPISVDEYIRLHQEGLETLAVYLPHVSKSLPPTTKEELKLRVPFLTGLPELPEITLTGMFDRLDFDEQGRVIQVVDYKTGTPKSRNAIEGKTASSDGAYKRQLVFYALLLKLSDDERFNTRQCTLTFVKPDGKGVIHEETFVISDEEIAELESELKAAVASIVAGDFLTTPVTEADTEYYQFVALLQGR